MNDVDLTNISDKFQWNGSLAVPVGEATLTLEDLLAQLDSQNILITEGQEILYQDSDSIDFRFREIDLAQYSQSLVKSYNVSPIVVTIPARTTFPTLSSNENIDLGLNNSPNEERVDSVVINSAVLSVKVTVENININPGNLKLKLNFPIDKVHATNGSSVNISFTPTAFNQAENVTISNFVINTSGNATGIPLTLQLDITTGSLPVTVGPTSKVGIELKFTGFDYKVAYGFFTPAVIATKILTQDMDLPSFTDDGLFLFANPKAFLTVKSNIGEYLKFNVDYVKAYPKSNPSQEVYASFNGSSSTFESMGNKPAAPGNWVVKQLRTLDKDYGSTDLLFGNENKPDVLEYKYSVGIDNSINDPTPDFITPDGTIKVLYKIQIPLYLKPGSYYEFKDTLVDAGEDINSALEDVEVNSGSIFLTVSNGLPVKGKLTLALKDSLGRDISTTFTKEYDIDAPQVDAEGYVVESGITPQKIEIALNNDQLNDFKNSKDIVYTFRIDSRDTESFIHFRKSDSFKVKLGLFVNGKVSSDLNNND
ncbi:MAG: hypothetical protein GX429_08975 [Bacteroidales bacterium]|nr:hypothetical protein [Bacteroidales bacterium]